MPTKRRLTSHVAGDDDGCRDGAAFDDDSSRTTKRLRGAEPRRPWSPPPLDLLSTLSDELLVRALSYLNERTLLQVSAVSKRFHRITSDSQLWRPHYYRRFVLPRAHRIPGFRAGRTRNSSKLHYSAQKSMWADGGWGRRGGLVEPCDASDNPSDRIIDWKKQYKLRHNWAHGRCAVDEVRVNDTRQPPTAESNTLVKVVDGLAVTVALDSGLQAWDLRTRSPVAQIDIKSAKEPLLVESRPTCLAVDDQCLADNVLDVVVGFEDGTFGIWRLEVKRKALDLLYRHNMGFMGGLVAVAYGHPYVLTATEVGSISLYTFDRAGPERRRRTSLGSNSVPSAASSPAFVPSDGESALCRETIDEESLQAPYLLSSLKSHSTRLPMALSIRKMAASTVASIAYTFDAIDGWCIGIQDLDIQRSGLRRRDLVTSRVAYTLPTQTRGPAPPSPQPSPLRGRPTRHSPKDHGPIRLCYSHPYLLATLTDNTLVLHLCTSTATSLLISPSIRLWGHTSGISDAEITPRGKAVSVSMRGDEIRVWELEGRVGGSSVEVRPRQQQIGGTDTTSCTEPTGRLCQRMNTDSTRIRNRVGFDDEMVIVLEEKHDGRESLMVYDFT